MDADDPRHGENAGYCAHRGEGSELCFPCRVAHANYESARRRLQAYGQWHPWVPAEEARQHVRDLMAAGMGIQLVARAAGVYSGRITHLLYGRGGKSAPRQIRPAYSDAILAVEPQSRRVPAVGAQRRLGALSALGHPQTYLAARLGWNQRRVNQVFLTTGTLERRTHDAIAVLYGQLSMTLPPEDTKGEKYAASKARNTAARHGFPTPMAWDDDTIDDPAAKPRGVGHVRRYLNDVRIADEYDDAVVERVLGGEYKVPATAAERRVIVTRWPGSLADLERVTGWKVERYTDKEPA